MKVRGGCKVKMRLHAEDEGLIPVRSWKPKFGSLIPSETLRARRAVSMPRRMSSSGGRGNQLGLPVAPRHTTDGVRVRHELRRQLRSATTRDRAVTSLVMTYRRSK